MYMSFKAKKVDKSWGYEIHRVNNKEEDYCSGAMAKTVAANTNAHVMYSKYIQEDPNYYDLLGIDYHNRLAHWNSVGYEGLSGCTDSCCNEACEFEIQTNAKTTKSL